MSSHSEFEDEKAALQHQSESKRKSWSAPALALEVFSIVLGVLLALAFSGWAEDREHQRLAESALLNISKEISSNFETLTLIHANNVQTVNAITTQSESDADQSRSIIPGIQLQETAWEAFLATAYATALGTTVDERHFQEQFIGYFQLLTQIEAQLLSSYREALDTFDL